MSSATARPALPHGMRVLEMPGLPSGVEVRASVRRRRSVAAFRELGRTVVVVPARMPRAEIVGYVRELVGRLQAREQRTRCSDEELRVRADELSRRYLAGAATPRSVRWVDNQRARWGSCTPADASIRLSSRLRTMPAYVVDYVLLHELVHLLVPGHGPRFHARLKGFEQLAQAQAFLAGVDHATGLGWSGPAGDPDEGLDGDVEGDVEVDLADHAGDGSESDGSDGADGVPSPIGTLW